MIKKKLNFLIVLPLIRTGKTTGRQDRTEKVVLCSALIYTHIFRKL